MFAGVRKEADKASVLAECEASRGAGACASLVPIILDVTKAEQIAAAVATVTQWVEGHKQPLVAVVNNAGITIPGPTEMSELENFRTGLQQNFLLTWRLLQSCFSV